MVWRGLGAQADLFDDDLLLSLARFALFLSALVCELAEIDYAANRGIRIGRYLDQVHMRLVGNF
jgi:hypothetical protein